MSCDFDEFWSCYPRKVAKGAARRAFAKAIKIATMEEILEGVARYRQELLRKGTEVQFVAHPSTWLNGERWSDQDGLDLGEQDDRPPPGKKWIYGDDAAAYAHEKWGAMTKAPAKLLAPEEWKR